MAKEEGLSESQERALDALVAGKTYAQAASDAGTDRATLRRWLETDAAFVVEYNRRRSEVRSQVFDRVDALWPKALDVVEQALDGQDPAVALQAAAFLLRATSLHKMARRSGPTDAEDVRIDWAGKENSRILDRMLATAF